MKIFECLGCGDCCYGEGGIIVGEGEASRIAEFLGISEREFLNSYCENRNGKTYIKSGPDGWCIFFDSEKKCTIHPAKPARCALWPFFPEILRSRHAWEMAKEGCPGISRECSFEEFVKVAGDYIY
ncbi:MAG: YkgJ family cysteine cluster protein [Desulfatiglandaceae bacterium]